jgi:hypothetical protein
MTKNNKIPFKIGGANIESIAGKLFEESVHNPEHLAKVISENPDVVELNHISEVLTEYEYRLYDELKAGKNTREGEWTDEQWRNATKDLATRIGAAVVATQDLLYKMLYEKGARSKEEK